MNLPGKNSIEGYCSICKAPLPKGALYCKHCGPPEIHLDNPEKGLPASKTAVRILILVAVFVFAVALKLDFQLGKLFSHEKVETEVTEPDQMADDQDYELVHYINAEQASLRESPSDRAKVVATLQKGAPVKILDKGEVWSQVQAGETTGWVATGFLTGTIR